MEASLDAKNVAKLPISLLSIFIFKGVFRTVSSLMVVNPGIPREANVAIGPALIVLTRTPSLPRSSAKERTVDSNDAFAVLIIP